MALPMPTTIEKLDIDVLQNILARLSAVDFASADCVCHSWNNVCSLILCSPKLASACSTNPSLHVAIEEVANKVLSKPIRPQFAFAFVGRLINLREAFQLITAKLSSKVPVIIQRSSGIIGSDAISDEFKEIWLQQVERGIMLTAGFFPGMKVKSIPLLKQVEHPEAFMIDKFITDIWEFSTSISGRQSPAAIVIFSKYHLHLGMNIMEELDYAMSLETVIVGGFCFDFRHTATEEVACDAVALVIAMDRNKPPGIGETKFHAVVSPGLTPLGPAYRVDSAENPVNIATQLLVHKEGPFETMEMDEMDGFFTRDIGVTKRRKFSIGQEKAKWMTSLAFHQVVSQGPENESLDVTGVGIKTGDTFRCCYLDDDDIISSADGISNLLRSFKQRSTNGSDKWEVFGGLIFTSAYRGQLLSGQPYNDSSVFLENFPGVTIAGTKCFGEIARGYLTPQESEEQKSAQGRFLHLHSAVYFIMSYAP